MKHRLFVCLVMMPLLAATAGCTNPESHPVQPQLLDLSLADVPETDAHALRYLASALALEGLHVTDSTTLVDPGIFGDDARFYALGVDEAKVLAFVPDPPEDTASLASRVSSMGTSFEIPPDGILHLNLVGRPYFFRDENLIVMYLESAALVGELQPRVSQTTDHKVIRVLTRLFGEPFAGGP